MYKQKANREISFLFYIRCFRYLYTLFEPNCHIERSRDILTVN